MIVDSHTHVWSSDRQRYRLAAGQRPRPPAPPVERLLAEMAAAGVARAVLVQPIHYQHDNRYLAACLRAHPGRFAGVGLIDQRAPDAPQRLQRLVQKDGLSGLRIHLGGPRMPEPEAWAGPDQVRLWQQAEALGASFCVFGPAALLPALEPMMARFPAVAVVLDHVGGIPAPTAADHTAGLDYVAGLRRYGNVYVKFTPRPSKSVEAFPHRDLFGVYRRLLDAYGPRRLLWGASFPSVLAGMGYAGSLALFAEHLDGLSAEERGWLLGGTAARLYGWP